MDWYRSSVDDGLNKFSCSVQFEFIFMGSLVLNPCVAVGKLDPIQILLLRDY